MGDLGRRVFGLAAIWLGVVGLIWDDFAAVWQPVPDALPGRGVFAYAAAAVLLAAGAALQWRKSAKWAAIVLAVLYGVFALLWARRIIGFPQVFGVWSGTAEQLALVVGALVVWARLRDDSRTMHTGRLVFGLCLLAFGLAHFLYVKETAALVPGWIPPGVRFWAYATGACHIAAGLALLSGIQARLAARLATAMFAGFGLLVWLPQLFSHPRDHMAWAGNGVNLALVGAAWVMADAMARLAASARGGPGLQPGEASADS